MKNFVRIISLIVLICLVFCGCQKNVPQENSKVEKNVLPQSEPVTPLPESTQQQTSEPLKTPQLAVIPPSVDTAKNIVVKGVLESADYADKIAELESVLNQHLYNISLVVYAVDGSKALYYNTQSTIFGACTVKAAYTLYACKQMEAGNGNLSVPLTYEEKHYESGTGDMQYSPFGTVFTMETALHKSMSISDNVGYIMSVDYFGRDGYNQYVRELGCDSLQIKPTVWSLKTRADDLVKIWCEIYNYFQTDTEYARFLKNSCTGTAANYATAALRGVDYSHKQGHNSTGDWLSLSDAGIVWKGDTPYIIALLTDAPGPSAYSAGEFAKIISIVHNDLF